MNIKIKPVFKVEGYDYAFDPPQRLPKGSNAEYRYIIDVLRSHLGDDLDCVEEYGIFLLPQITAEDLDIVTNIYEDTEYNPIKYGRCYLWFEIVEIIHEEIENV